MTKISIQKDFSVRDHDLLISGQLKLLTMDFILKHSSYAVYNDDYSYKNVLVKSVRINQGEFTNQTSGISFPIVSVTQEDNCILLSCGCAEPDVLLCGHQSQVLTAITKNQDLMVFFDKELRAEKIRHAAKEYGLENDPQVESLFDLSYIDKKSRFIPVNPGILPVNKEGLGALRKLIITQQELLPDTGEEQITGVVFKQHKYYKNLLVELFTAATAKNGRVKNPVTPLSARDLIWRSEENRELKFFTGITAFEHALDSKRAAHELAALRAIFTNPLDYPFFYHDSSISEKHTSTSLIPVKGSIISNNLTLKVSRNEQFYELTLAVEINGREYDLKELDLKFGYFLLLNDQLFLVDNLQMLALIDLLKNKNTNLLVHASQYKEFKRQLLEKLEDELVIDYQYIRPATPQQLEHYEAENETERIIYLSDFGSQVMIHPVMRYGEAEIPVRSRRQVYQLDKKGNEFLIYRDFHEETLFISLLVRLHPFLREQLTNGLQYFYLHKKRFLEEDWFLNAFEELERAKVTVLGFNELSGHKLNPHKVKIDIKVISGVNWFNAIVNARFGKKKATLQGIHRAIRNKTKFVRLDDGSHGILPAEWIERFSKYFNAGEIVDDETLQTPKSNFTAIEKYYDAKMLSEEVSQEIGVYKQKLANFDNINTVAIPEGLNATLRPYQQAGLNWLNFLDDFNFGGCLADDMGLGKSLQIIAFILSQRAKTAKNVNLLIVPTSLVFNWKSEIARFAPSIRVKTVYGADRQRRSVDWANYEVILTTYGTLLSDITILKNYEFNYIFLDESQNIKNPESQRYKAARALKSRNRVVITGTPIENNTFDLYGQLSFACPGLLGNKRYFRDIYSTPIDMFNDSRRAEELQQLIKPFVLRRTKQQVAAELPDKTEMILYCTMQSEQRKIYDAYEKEFRDYISASNNDELKKSPMNVLKGLTTLRQVCDSPLLLPDRKLTGEASAKIEVLLEQIENKRADHKILVFSQFVSMLDLIKTELINRDIRFSYLTGQTTKREEVINEFQNNSDIRVFLISLKAGGTGLNLTAADYVYLVDPWWNPAVENQAIDRVHRIGQDKHIVAVRLICEGTVEEKILKLQDAKKALAKDLIKSDQSLVKSFSKEELLEILNG